MIFDESGFNSIFLSYLPNTESQNPLSAFEETSRPFLENN